MFEPLYVVPMLLLLAVVWFAGRTNGLRRTEVKDASQQVARHYFQGINFLLNEQPDQAIDTFIRSVEVTPSTLETHLALGNLMRQRGEIDRAIRVHQNLLSRPNLSILHIRQAHLELGRDFLKAGLFDRAERLFLELVEDDSGELRQSALRHLIQIYQNEKEWEKAIRAAEMMEKKRFVRGPNELAVEQSHFCCELAVKATAEGDFLQARRQLKSSLKFNGNSARANLLWGDLELKLGNYAAAIKRYGLIPQQQPDYLPEILLSVRQCYRALGDQDGLVSQLRLWLESYPGTSLLRMATEEMSRQQGESQAIIFLADYLKAKPSLKGLHTLLTLHLNRGDEGLEEHLILLRDVLGTLEAKRPVYRCSHCGFKGVQLHWLCPQCKCWETVKPVKGVDGE